MSNYDEYRTPITVWMIDGTPHIVKLSTKITDSGVEVTGEMVAYKRIETADGETLITADEVGTDE